MAHVRNRRCIDPSALAPPERHGMVDVTAPAPSDQAGVDELLEWIENSDSDARFVPDLSGESYKNAA
jgi:hypothetical protein